MNDVSALRHDPASASVVAAHGCPVILMHMRGTPDTMTALAQYGDVAAEVAAELAAAVARAKRPGSTVRGWRSTRASASPRPARRTCRCCAASATWQLWACPLVVGVSRKRFIGALGGRTAPRDRVAGSLAAALFALSRGARILRVHDVAATVEAVRVWHALAG